MDSANPIPDATPTAAVGYQFPILGTTLTETRTKSTFTLKDVITLVSSITSKAASSAVSAALAAN